MYKTSKDTQIRKDAKRQHILDRTVKVFAVKRYHNATVKDIVDEAAVSIGSCISILRARKICLWSFI